MARDNEPLYSISVTARLIGTTPRALRIYEDAELIAPYRTQGNTRLYSKNDLKKLEVICYFHKVREVNLPGVKLLMQVISLDRGSQDKEGSAVIPLARLKEIAPELAAKLKNSEKG